MAKELFEVVGSGAVKINVNQTYPLKDAAQAHRDLEGRKTTGSTVFTVIKPSDRCSAGVPPACRPDGRRYVGSRLRRPLAARLVSLQMSEDKAQERCRHALGATAADHVADDVLGLDRSAPLDVAQHRSAEGRRPCRSAARASSRRPSRRAPRDRRRRRRGTRRAARARSRHPPRPGSPRRPSRASGRSARPSRRAAPISTTCRAGFRSLIRLSTGARAERRLQPPRSAARLRRNARRRRCRSASLPSCMDLAGRRHRRRDEAEAAEHARRAEAAIERIEMRHAVEQRQHRGAARSTAGAIAAMALSRS